MPDMAEFGVDTSNTFALLDDEAAKKKNSGKAKDDSGPAARKKVDKKDKEKHGQPARGGNAPAAEPSGRVKKHEFDRRPGPGPQRKVDKRTGAKWDQDVPNYQDETDAFKDDLDTRSPLPDGATQDKDGKVVKPEDSWVDLDEFRKAQKAKRPEGDDLKPRAARVDGDFRAAKELVKEEEPPAFSPEEKQPSKGKKVEKKVEKKETKQAAPSKKKSRQSYSVLGSILHAGEACNS